jgi:methylaspartate ammonia-lyase
MRVVDVLAVPVRAGFFFDDQLDEGLMIVGNEMARTAALVRAREAAR